MGMDGRLEPDDFRGAAEIVGSCEPIEMLVVEKTK